MKFVIFTIFVIIAVAITASQGEGECSPWGKVCQVHENCCRHLTCLGAAAKCVPKSGLIVPGADKRPLGPGPYPPNVPDYELPN